jgi:hypothetical protein
MCFSSQTSVQTSIQRTFIQKVAKIAQFLDRRELESGMCRVFCPQQTTVDPWLNGFVSLVSWGDRVISLRLDCAGPTQYFRWGLGCGMYGSMVWIRNIS